MTVRPSYWCVWPDLVTDRTGGMKARYHIGSTTCWDICKNICKMLLMTTMCWCIKSSFSGFIQQNLWLGNECSVFYFEMSNEQCLKPCFLLRLFRSLCVCWGESCSWYGSTSECVMRCDGSVTLPQHELVACNGSGAGAGENLTHVLHQTQAVLCVQPEAVWQLPLLDTGRALSYSFVHTGCETFLAEPKTLMNVSEELS